MRVKARNENRSTFFKTEKAIVKDGERREEETKKKKECYLLYHKERNVTIYGIEPAICGNDG